MSDVNHPEYFDDLSDEELMGARRVATNRLNEARAQAERSRVILCDIARVEADRRARKAVKK